MLSKEEHMVIQLLILASVWRRNLNKMGFIRLEQDAGLAQIMREICLFMQKKRVT